MAVLAPAFAEEIEAINPAGPAPMIATSVLIVFSLFPIPYLLYPIPSHLNNQFSKLPVRRNQSWFGEGGLVRHRRI
jgi:hypothetical protein